MKVTIEQEAAGYIGCVFDADISLQQKNDLEMTFIAGAMVALNLLGQAAPGGNALDVIENIQQACDKYIDE